MSPINAHGAANNVLVLGGSSDIGVAIAAALVDRGSRHVILAGRDSHRLREAATCLSTRTSIAHFDADDLAGHEPLIRELTDSYGDIDVCILAFGVLPSAPTLDDPLGAASVAHTNYTAAVSAATAVTNQMRIQGSGLLVVLSSVAGERARPSNFLYGSSKAGLDAFAMGLGMTLEGEGVRVVVVRPGFVISRMTRGRRSAPFATTPSAVAEATLRAIDRGRAMVRVPGIFNLIMPVLRVIPRGFLLRLGQ